MKKKLSRYKVREQAFILCFEKMFHNDSIDDIIVNTFEGRDLVLDDEVIQICKEIENRAAELDDLISKYLKSGWKLNRISKISFSILRLALYEMLYIEDIPVNVSINEAIELSKKYSGPEDGAFVNGVLANIERALKLNEKESSSKEEI